MEGSGFKMLQNQDNQGNDPEKNTPIDRAVLAAPVMECHFFRHPIFSHGNEIKAALANDYCAELRYDVKNLYKTSGSLAATVFDAFWAAVFCKLQCRCNDVMKNLCTLSIHYNCHILSIFFWHVLCPNMTKQVCFHCFGRTT